MKKRISIFIAFVLCSVGLIAQPDTTIFPIINDAINVGGAIATQTGVTLIKGVDNGVTIGILGTILALIHRAFVVAKWRKKGKLK